MDKLTFENLLAQNELLRAEILELKCIVADQAAEIEMLRDKLSGGGNGSSAAPFIKPNRAQRREAGRQQRNGRSQSFSRKRDIPTEEICHVVHNCPDCGRKLKGGWEHSRRQTIEIPHTPIKIIDHVLIARRCGACGKVHIPKLGVAEGVVGKCRVGPRLMSLISTLAIAKRMPQRSIQKLLESLYGVPFPSVR